MPTLWHKVLSLNVTLLSFLGWRPEQFGKWIDSKGNIWHLNSKVPPQNVVKELVNSYVNKELTRASEHFDGLGMQNGIDWDSSLKIIRNAKAENMLKTKTTLEAI